MDINKYIARQIEFQFPEIYREEGTELVELIKDYYSFLETSQNQSTYNNRRMFDYNDIDGTLPNMLLFFKNKFLSDLPFNGVDTRFIVKHILDFYRRKGTHEGIELFFKLFYDANIQIYYPSNDILKPSSSRWVIDNYIELYPTDPDNLMNIRETQIYGDISGATATVNRVNFIILNSSIIPVLSISNIKGQFGQNDTISSNQIIYGTVRSSLNSVSIDNAHLVYGLANNHVGDLLDISGYYGYGAKGRVSEISENITTDIIFTVVDGGSGFTVSNTEIIISNQTIFVDNPNQIFNISENVIQISTGAFGTVVGQNKISVGVNLLSSNSFNLVGNILTTDRISNISLPIQFVTPRNDTASASLGTITNTHSVNIITDILGNYLDVPLNANNYSDAPALIPLSGNYPTGLPPINANTIISTAFIPREFIVGTINTLTDINPGTNYVNDVFVYAIDKSISRYNITNQFITFNPLTSYNVNIGDVIVQHSYSGNTTNFDIVGLVKDKDIDILTVMPLSFETFNANTDIYVQNTTNPIDVVHIEKDYTSASLGSNANITGTVESTIGKINKVEVIDSGIGFLNKTTVYMKNRSKINEYTNLMNSTSDLALKSQYSNMIDFYNTTDVAIGVGSSRYQGITAGRWESKTSHLNSAKYIQDSNFYQDFSYRIDSNLNKDLYIDTLKKLNHVSGTKVFHKFYLESNINNTITISDELIIF